MQHFNTSLKALEGLSLMCQCGNRHDFASTNVLIGQSAHVQAVQQLTQLGQKALVIHEPDLASKALLSAASRSIMCQSMQLPPPSTCPTTAPQNGTSPAHTDKTDRPLIKQAIQTLSQHEDCRAILAIGGHQANELAKLVAATKKLPLVTLVTKLNSDCFCTGSSLLRLGDRYRLTRSCSPDILAIDTTTLPTQRMDCALGLVSKAALTLVDYYAHSIQQGVCPMVQQLLTDSLRQCLFLHPDTLTPEDSAVIAHSLVRISQARHLYAHSDSLNTCIDAFMLTLSGYYDYTRAAAASRLLLAVYSQLLHDNSLTLPVNGIKLMELSKALCNATANIQYQPSQDMWLQRNKTQLIKTISDSQAMQKLINANYDTPLEGNTSMLKARLSVSSAIYGFSGILRTKVLSGSALSVV